MIPAQGTKSHVLQLRACMLQLKILHGKIKTWCSQIKKQILKEKAQLEWAGTPTPSTGYKISTLCFERHPERQVPILRPTCWINYSYVPNVKLSMQKYSKFMNKFMWHARSYEEFSMILSKNHRSKCKKTNHRHQHVATSILKDGHLHPPWSGTPALGLQSNPGQPKLPPNPPASSPILQTIPLSQDRRGGS